MGAIKKMLPDNWFDIKDDEITIINVSATGFTATMTINDNGIMTDNFGHNFNIEEIGSIKEMIERMIMDGFTVEVQTNKKEVKPWKN